MTIVILADSLTLPRKKDRGNIPTSATYPYLLHQYLKQCLGNNVRGIIARGAGYRTIQDVITDWPTEVNNNHATMVIIQVGIVDCAPRVFLPTERERVQKLHPEWLRNSILDFVHKHRRQFIKVFPNRVYVPLDSFRWGVRQVIQNAKISGLQALIFINIISPPNDLEYRSPGIQKNVAAYNACLQEELTQQPDLHLIDLDYLIQEQGGPITLTVDGIHINQRGHQILAKALKTLILKFEQECLPNQLFEEKSIHGSNRFT